MHLAGDQRPGIAIDKRLSIAPFALVNLFVRYSDPHRMPQIDGGFIPIK